MNAPEPDLATHPSQIGHDVAVRGMQQEVNWPSGFPAHIYKVGVQKFWSISNASWS